MGVAGRLAATFERFAVWPAGVTQTTMRSLTRSRIGRVRSGKRETRNLISGGLAVVGRANGSDAKLHGQGPRAEARAARGAPACEARVARRVTP